MAGGKNAFYSVEFKQEAVQRYQEGGISYRELSEQLELKSKTQLQNGWLLSGAEIPLKIPVGKMLSAVKATRVQRSPLWRKNWPMWKLSLNT